MHELLVSGLYDRLDLEEIKMIITRTDEMSFWTCLKPDDSYFLIALISFKKLNVIKRKIYGETERTLNIFWFSS